MSKSAIRAFRRLVLPLAAILIVAACWWKLSSPDVNVFARGVSSTRNLAPTFALYDQNSRLLKLDAYLHRHDIILVFYDAEDGVDGSAAFDTLLANRDLLTSRRVITIGVSTVLPQDNRKAVGEDFPFILLTDLQAGQPDSACSRWGCVSAVTPDEKATVLPRVFHIDRAGTVAWREDAPAAETDLAGTLERIRTSI